MGDAAANNTPLIDRGDAISNAPKNEIPGGILKAILIKPEQMQKIQPLIAEVVFEASSIEGLRDDITNLFEAKKTRKLTDALTKLQEQLQEIYRLNYKDAPLTSGQWSGGRRKSKKRNNYKKRRTTKQR
jgi:hypothetical protein